MLEFLELPHRPQTRVYCSALLALISQEMIRELSFQRGFELLLFLLFLSNASSNSLGDPNSIRMLIELRLIQFVKSIRFDRLQKSSSKKFSVENLNENTLYLELNKLKII